MRGLRDPREPAAFALLVLLGFVVARFLGVALHEVVGHGLATIALGGSFYGVYISPGSGFALVFIPEGIPAAGSAAVALAGIAVEIALGVALLSVYRRVKTFLSRLSLLLVLEVLLVSSFVYLAVGAFDGTGGDSAQAAVVLESPHLVAGFLVVGLLWATACAYGISREVVRLTAPAEGAKRQLLYLSLFWFTPLAVGVVPGLIFTSSLSDSLLVYFLLFLVIGGSVFAASAYLASRVRPRASPQGPPTPVGHALPVVIAFLLVLPAWLLPFGPTDGTAHGLLLAEPPLAAEGQWANPVAVNVRAVLREGRNLTLEFRLKGVPEPGSPLERRVVDSYELRPDLAYWADAASLLASSITNVSAWNVTLAGIEGNGTAWIAGRTVRNPRLVVLDVARPGDALRLVPLTSSPPATFVQIVLRDPWQFDPSSGCPGCYLDELAVTWPAGSVGESYVLVRVEERGGYAERVTGFDALTAAGFARFRNYSPDTAPASYILTFEWRVPP